MSAPHQILLYWRERGEAFLARAREHALANHPGLQLVQRHPAYFGWDGCEATAAIVYVEARFDEVVASYRQRGVPVFTETDLPTERGHDVEDHGQEAAVADERDAAQGRLAAEGQEAGTREEVVRPITAARRGRRRVA